MRSLRTPALLALCALSSLWHVRAVDADQPVDDRIVREALIADLVNSTSKTIDIEGFGTFSLREYPAYEGRDPLTGESIHVEAKVLPFLRVTPQLRDVFTVGSVTTRPHFRCEAVTKRVAKNLHIPEGRVAKVFDEWLGGTVEALRQSRTVALLGDLGVLILREKRERNGVNPQTGELLPSPTRTVVSFLRSQQWAAKLNKKNVAFVDAEQIDAVLAAYPARGIDSPATLVSVLDRLQRKKQSGTEVAEIERVIEKPLPSLLRTLIERDDPLDGQGNVPLTGTHLLTRAAQYEAQLPAFRRSPRDRLHAVVPFAIDDEGSAWCYCNDASSTADPWVFFASTEPSGEHPHDLRLSPWVAASLMLRELETLTTSHFLRPRDVAKVLAWLQALDGSGRHFLGAVPY